MLKVINSIRNDVEGSNGKCESRCNKTAGAEKVYEKKEYIILKVKKGYIVYNTKKEFENGHTHLQSFEMSKTIIIDFVGFFWLISLFLYYQQYGN